MDTVRNWLVYSLETLQSEELSASDKETILESFVLAKSVKDVRLILYNMSCYLSGKETRDIFVSMQLNNSSRQQQSRK